MPEANTHSYEESGLRFTLPQEHFRFMDCPTYDQLKSWSLKEMDFCWLEANRVLLVEVKDFRVASHQTLDSFLPANNASPSRFLAWVDKVTDAMLLLHAVWLKTEKGQTLGAELPEWVQQPTPLTFIIAICLPTSLSQHLGVLRQKMVTRLKGRMALGEDFRFAFMGYEDLITHYHTRVQWCDRAPIQPPGT